MFTLATAGYAATGALSWRGGRVTAHPLARVHLGAILGAFFLLLAVRLWLGRYALLPAGSSEVQGIFGFTDAQARLPALQTQTVIAVGAAFGTLWGAWKNRMAVVLGSFTAVLLATVLIGELYPAFVQSFRVEPNELVRETPYIEHNLEFTRRGFGLYGELERRRFAYTPDEPLDAAAVAAQLDGLPVWNEGPLLATYHEDEARFSYYDFLNVAIDRYEGPAGPVPMAVSVREIDPDGIQDQNWQNLHLRERYVTGMGAVATLASRRTDEGRPAMVLAGIPPVNVGGEATSVAESLSLIRPEVFFGTRRRQSYAVVTPGPDQYLAPDSTPGRPGVDFPEGIALRSMLRTALLAWRFRDETLLFSSELTDDSRLIFRRSVVERVAAIAPFLDFPEDPYPVIADGRIVWVLEGFVTSGWFPLASPNVFDGFASGRVRYVRNSYKITVDAVTGAVAFYRVPIEDPYADAMERAFPDLFVPIDQMPPSVRSHVRYSRALLDLQSRVLLQYHQETAPAFHGQQDVWDEPQELAEGTTPVDYGAEYGIYRLPGEDIERFQLTTLFVPAGRANLTAILVARTDASGVPELVLIDVPVEDQIRGPQLIEALIEQDPQISQQLSLWRTQGSQVWTGHLHLVPVGGRLIFMEPIFLAAEQAALPELRRFVVSDGRQVAMTETLSEAIAQLTGAPVPSTDPGPEGRRSTPDTGEWPAAALDLLDEAEGHARAGDWGAYGEALQRLRSLLQGLGGGGR